VPDPSILDTDMEPERDRWEFAATKDALEKKLPIFAICKGMQLFNVALGGTLRLDIPGHNAPEMKNQNIQPLRTDRSAAHRLDKVNSSHHQALDKLGDGLEVEAWCATDDVIEQVRLRDYPFALAVQYHPERGDGYEELFADFVSRLGNHSVKQ
jgi:putative glutamine amidotransferase